jgi:hypothetical protein
MSLLDEASRTNYVSLDEVRPKGTGDEASRTNYVSLDEVRPKGTGFIVGIGISSLIGILAIKQYYETKNPIYFFLDVSQHTWLFLFLL